MANPDATLLSWITAEVNQALSGVREQIGRFLEKPADTALLQGCSDHLHQVSGALRMVGLAGATRFCEALEASFSGLTSATTTPQAVDCVGRGVTALKEFVEGLERGQSNVPLRLYPMYRELVALQGGAEAPEKDLFFPDIALPAPPPAGPESIAMEDVNAFLLAQRVQFQRGLLAWLRNAPGGLEAMTQAVEPLYRCAPLLPEPRALWWVALGFLDLLKERQEPAWAAANKALAGRIDLQMRDLAAGSHTAREALLRELLYALATCEAPAPLAREIRAHYQLDALFPTAVPAPASPELASEWLEAALYDLHSRLDALKSAWVQYVSGEQKSAGRFQELVASFKGKASELGNPHMTKLLEAIGLVAKSLPDPYPRQNPCMVIEMASAFLLLENVIDRFSSPPEDLDEQIVILGGWLLDAAQGKSSGEPPPGLRADLVQQIGALQLRAQVAREIGVNLQHMEQVLDAFARDPTKRASLEGLKPYVHQIQGALKVLGFARAAEVIEICENMIAACAVVELGKAAEELDWIAEGLSSVGFYLRPCLHGRPPGEQAIDLFFQRFSKRIDQPAPGSWAQETSILASAVAPQDPAEGGRSSVDAELLGIFLEEAAEVLRGIEAPVQGCASQPHDLEPLTAIRRGFHTLKGSGRMVGLMDLGEVAWEIEQLLNVWLEQKRPATGPLLEFVGTASRTFSGWVEALRAGALAGEVDASALVGAARALRESPVEPSLLDIYLSEAAGHVATLEREIVAWRKVPGSDASLEMMRAAHTLASSSNTASRADVAALAAALEHWVPFARQTTQPADVELLGAAIARLSTMVGAIARGEAEVDGSEEARRVRELTERLQASPPPLDEKRVMRDDIDTQLLPVFLEEAQELVPAIGGDLRDWKTNPADQRASQSLRRSLHTLKGSARMAGAIRLGELTHLMESRVEAALELGQLPQALFAELEEKMDRLSAEVDRMRGAPRPQPSEEVVVSRLEKPRAPGAMLRIKAQLLDHVINEAGEVSLARSRVEAELRAVRQALGDLADSVARLRGQLREVEIQADSQVQSRMSVLEEGRADYDPLEFDRYTRLQELTRLMAESLNDIVSIERGLARGLGEADGALLAQARTTREVQQELMRMRAVPFSNLKERLYRVVRQTARELGKQAELEVSGAEVELDRSVLERIAAPLEHILRNALAHGIEAPEARVAAGKPPAGTIGVALRQEANEIALVLTDDGAGIDLEGLHRRAVEKGIVAAEAELSESEKLQLVFAAGLSTADEVTQLAGRGVGMDVVKNQISAIGGRVDVAASRGQGTSCTVYLPLTLAVTQAVLVTSGGSVFAVPTAMVEQVLRMKSEEMQALYAARQAQFRERTYPLYALQRLLDGTGRNEIQPYNSVLLLRSGIQRIALHVDELAGNQEIVVKSIGPQLARLPWMGGATVLADGRIVPILNPVVLAQRVRDAARAFGTTTTLRPAAEARQAAAPLIMVVDDSLTVRKITARLLQREGYRVATAKDGLDALEQMREALPAVLLVDIEMPRMDGFELTRTVRGDPRTRQIPIIVISSRTAEKHRAQATAVGVNAFLGKPYQEAELLEQIHEVRAPGTAR